MATENLCILVDIGSTFTKVCAVDLGKPCLLTRLEVPTTPSDVSKGLENGLDALAQQLSKSGVTAGEIKRARKLACSSAAGGLQMVAIGLVTDLTAEAAKQAALGAGARVLKTYSFQLTESDRDEIERLQPDIILLAGGTDGGNHTNIIHNAKMLAGLSLQVPVVIAGNRSVAAEAAGFLADSFSTYITENVMPEIGRLQVEPARQVIRQVFMEKIVYAKGLQRACDLIDGIFMPTPAAVLRAGTLLNKGAGDISGSGDVMIVDVGGATTDVHSLGSGEPTRAAVVMRGLPEPFAKRTVEGDLGVRVSATALADAIGAEALGKFLQMSPNDVRATAESLTQVPDRLPITNAEKQFDQALGYFAAKIAVGRHVGRISEVYTPTGALWIQEGKDLSDVKRVIGTGGVFINSSDPLGMLTGVAQDQRNPLELRPREPKYFLDRDYLLAPIGLLAEDYAKPALRLLIDSLEEQVE